MKSHFGRNAALAFTAGVCLGGLAVFAALTKPWGKPETGTTLATVGGERITAEEFSRMATLRSGTGGAAPDKRVLLEEMIMSKALVARAKAEGLEVDANFQREVENLLAGKVRGKHFGEKASAEEPSGEAVKVFYEETIERYAQPERRKLAMIFVKAENPGSGVEDEEARRTKLEAVREDVAAANDQTEADAMWTKAAAEMSSDRASRYRSGDIGEFEAGKEYLTNPAVIEAGFGLSEAGEVSEIVEGKDGIYLVRLLALEKGGARPFDSVKEEVRHRLILHRQAGAEERFRQETLDAVAVDILEAVLEGIELGGAAKGSSSPGPPRVP